MWKNLKQIFRHPQYRVIATLFAINSLLFTFWLTRIPLIKSQLGLSEGELGLILFFGPVGSLTAMFVSNWLNSRLGEGRMSIYTMLLALLACVGPVYAPSKFWLGTSLVIMGFAGAAMNVAINAVVTILERRDRVRIMITCHGGWSLGGLIGSFVTSLLVGAGVIPWIHWLVIVAILISWTVWRAWPHIAEIRLEGERGPALVMPTRPVVGLALIGLCIMIGEGAAADWSGVYLAEVIKTSDYFVGMGYASFTFFMTLGRFYGDTLTARFGALKVIRGGTAIAAIGLLLVLLPTLFTALLGFGLMGLGLSCVVPVLFSESGQVPDLNPSMGIASVASAGYIGFLGGPVLIGLLAEKFSLSLGFGFILVLISLAFLFSPRALVGTARG